MLNLFPSRTSNCEDSSRRDFMMQVGGLGALGLSLPVALQLQAAQGKGAGSRGDVNCILIWTRGGTSHHDTLDPKPEAKSEVRGEFDVIKTALPGVQFTDQMPNFAKHLKNYAVMRNLNPRNGSHGTADAIMMSGKKFNPATTFPCFGSVAAKELGYRRNMPPYIQLGRNIDRRFGGGSSGYLGIAYNAFEIPDDPSSGKFNVRDVTLPSGMSTARMDRRRYALKAIDTLQRDLDKQSDALTALDDYHQNAFSMITSPATQKAFDLTLESAQTRSDYGMNSLGQSCLLARRLIESGTRFVTVTSGGWDTHSQNFKGLKKLLPPLDQAFPALVNDLKTRGMLDNTLVVWMTDFGRTPLINSSAGRDHWSTASVLTMAGAGTPPGMVLGKTDDLGGQPVDGEYYPIDVAATVYSKLGIDPETIHHTPDGRPMLLCDGRKIHEFMG